LRISVLLSYSTILTGLPTFLNNKIKLWKMALSSFSGGGVFFHLKMDGYV